MAISYNALVERGLEALRSRLPKPWELAPLRRAARLPKFRPDALVRLRAPDGISALVLIEARQRLTAQQAAALAPRLTVAASQARAAGALLVAQFLSRMTRDRLVREGVSYLDLTGNIRVALDRPALLIEAQGAEKDPNPPDRGIRSLKGSKAARLVRALCDWRPPVGVRELAARAGTDPGYTSRVLSLLEQEDAIGRKSRGAVADVKWQELLRRWAQDYRLTETNRAVWFLAPRGLDALISRLRRSETRYALTGSYAVRAPASVSPARLLSCYVDDPERAATVLDLRPAEVGANVLLLEPFDPVIWERTKAEAGLTRVALSQCVVDLLTGTGREPAQAEALMSWMEGNQDAWRA